MDTTIAAENHHNEAPRPYEDAGDAEIPSAEKDVIRDRSDLTRQSSRESLMRAISMRKTLQGAAKGKHPRSDRALVRQLGCLHGPRARALPHRGADAHAI